MRGERRRRGRRVVGRMGKEHEARVYVRIILFVPWSLLKYIYRERGNDSTVNVSVRGGERERGKGYGRWCYFKYTFISFVTN